MSIESIEITGLRSFADTARLELAVPNDKPGSGLTILVGPNNSGKSTIIEAFSALTRRESISFTEGKRNKKAGDTVSVRITHASGVNKELRTIATGGSEAKWDNPNALPDPATIFVLPSRRTFAPYFGKNLTPRQNYITDYALPAMRSATIDHFSGRLFRIQENRVNFDTVLTKVLDPVPTWYIDQADSGNYYLKFRSGDSYHSSEGLGEGLISLLFIVDALYDSDPGNIIVIDEPELSLHPSLQRKLFKLLNEYAADRQIVISTHSPYFIGWEAILSGGKVVRVIKTSDATSLNPLSSDTITRLRGFITNLYNPHILGLDAREVFFLEDGVVLVEGQEDVVQYRRIAGQLGVDIEGDFFGWGVGGADNMPTIARMLSELGFKKVVGVLDKNKEDLIPVLETEFPDYKFFAIPADDVRTKPAVPAKDAVKGLLDEHGAIRTEYKEQLTGLFGDINSSLKAEHTSPGAPHAVATKTTSESEHQEKSAGPEGQQ